MENSRKLSVTIVNRYYPPNKSSIAEAANDLAIFLVEKGCDVKVVFTDGNYPGGGETGKRIVGQQFKTKAIYNGKSNFLRLIGNLIEGFFLIRKAKKINEGVIIVMTNPMLLNMWAGLMLNSKKTPWIYWSMDLFPEGFMAGNLIGKNNPIYKYIFHRSYKGKPDGMIALGDIQAKYLIECYKKDIPTVILPCGVVLNGIKTKTEDLKTPEWKTDSNKIYLGYIGHIGPAHSADFLKTIIDNLQTERQHLILVVYGGKAQIIKDYLKDNNKGVTVLDYLPREELKHLDVHLISLLSTWTNLSVPSKMTSAAHQGASVLFHGEQDCDTWQDHKEAGWLIQEGTNEISQIKSFLENLTKEVVEDKKQNAKGLPEKMTKRTVNAYHSIIKMIDEILN